MVAGVLLECQEEETLFDAPISGDPYLSQLQPSFDDKHLSDHGQLCDQELQVYDCPSHNDTSQPWAKRVLAAAPVRVIECVWSQDSSQLLYQTQDKEGNTEVQPMHIVVEIFCAFAWCFAASADCHTGYKAILTV